MPLSGAKNTHVRGSVYDAGGGEGAFDGKNTLPGQEAMWFSGALRITWPPADRFAATTRDLESSRFLQQATFGPTISDLQRLRTRSFAQWIDAQLAAVRQRVAGRRRPATLLVFGRDTTPRDTSEGIVTSTKAAAAPRNSAYWKVRSAPGGRSIRR